MNRFSTSPRALSGDPPAAATWGVSGLLRLLAEEAPESAYTEWLASFAARTGTDLSAEVVEAYQLARQVREATECRKGRESELAALYATAGDLSSLRDTDKVLRAIVRRARQLLHSDVAYLTMLDEGGGDTSMRVAEGMVTQALSAMRLPHGAGVSGLVAKTGEPFWTDHYLRDRRIIHVIDDLVAEEGLAGILGVPLLLAGDVIGVLFAADRARRRFAPGEVALLSSLGNHAAIALNNARLFEQSRQVVGELTAAHAAVQAQAEVVERAATVHQRLADLVLQGSDMTAVVAALAEVLDADLLVVGPDSQELASSAGSHRTLRSYLRLDQDRVRAGSSGPKPDSWESSRQQAFGLGRTVRFTPNAAGTSVWVTPVIAGAEHIAVMLSTRSTAFDDAELQTLERAAQVTALLLLTRRLVAAAEQRVRGELLDDLLSSYPVDETALTRRAALLGVDLIRSHAVVTARPVASSDRNAFLVAANAVSRELGGIAGEHDGSVVCLIPDLAADEAAGRVIARLDQLGAKATVGASGPGRGVAQLKDAHRYAARCERILLALGQTGGWSTPKELGIYGLLFSGASREQIDEFVQTRLGPVLHYDAQHDTRLVETLQVYFDCNANLVRTAGALYLHVNTLRQRLGRLGDLLGPQWREQGQLELHVAVKIHEIVGAF